VNVYAQEDKPATIAYKLKRRRFLALGALVTVSRLAPLPVFADARRVAGPPRAHRAEPLAYEGSGERLATLNAAVPVEKCVAIYNINTGEQLRTVYWCRGQYVPHALQEIAYLLRDYHANEVKAIDPQLLDLLYTLGQLLETATPFHVLSGYRSPATNAELRRSNRTVAVQSLHVEGKAVDIRLPGRDTALVRQAAVALQAGGVGHYPRKNCLHVDTGPVRYW
jgi:uncharacterized protein YcbK (DUF882 family)